MVKLLLVMAAVGLVVIATSLFMLLGQGKRPKVSGVTSWSWGSGTA
jgi:hypothetical protein